MRSLLIPNFFLFIILLSSCAESKKIPDQKNEIEQLFQKYCALCHGMDGSLKLNGAKDFSESTLSLNERISIVREGRNGMTPFKGILTPREVELVANYTIQFSKK